MATNTFSAICDLFSKGNRLNPVLDLYLAVSRGLCVYLCMFACIQAGLHDLYHNSTFVVHSRPRGPYACLADPLKRSLLSWTLWGLDNMKRVFNLTVLHQIDNRSTICFSTQSLSNKCV